jgi:hypothetical protein
LLNSLRSTTLQRTNHLSYSYIAVLN